MSDELLKLAERCEAATGPDRSLDCAIAVAAADYFLLPPKWDGGPVGYGYFDADGAEVHPGHGGDQLVKRYTASLDAAMTLVPEGMKLVLDTHHMIVTLYEYWPISSPEDEGFASYQAEAATPALALCAAALRARSHHNNQQEKGSE